MRKRLLMEEFHLSIFAPRGLPEKDYGKMIRAVRQHRFHTQLHSAIVGILRRFGSLTKTRVTLTR